MLKIDRNEAENLRAMLAERELRNAALEAELAAEIERRGLLETHWENKEARYLHTLEELNTRYEKLLASFKQAQREKFGRKSERFVDEDQKPLFESMAQEEDPEGTDASQEVETEDIAYTREKPKGRKKHEIPCREEIIPVSEEDRICVCCGKLKDVIGYECSSRLHHQPEVFEMVTQKREKVACRNGCGAVLTAALPPRLLPRCRVTEALLAHLFVTKVLDRQPLYHLEKKIESRYGWHIKRETMAKWMIMAADKLQVLVNRMKDTLLDYDVAAIDATTLQVLNEPQRPASVKSHVYCIRGGPPDKSVILYEYNAYSQKDYVTETLSAFKGVIHCDASPVFNGIAKEDGIKLSYCHAHARRKFEQIEKTAGKGKARLASEAMRFYGQLYAIEREAKAKNLSPEQRHQLRQEKSVPVLAEFKAWLSLNQARTMPKSLIGLAIAYCLTHWEGLQTYLSDGRVECDNNATERDIKPFVIARKNFLFACTQAGADSLGVHFSLILTARLHGLDPVKYMTHVLTVLPTCKTWDEYDRLLPWNVTRG